jgi:hypothetical protein
MKQAFYLCFRKKRRGWGQLHVRATDGLPNLESGEVSIRITADLPDVLFQKPMLEAEIKVPADEVGPTTIQAGVVDNIESIIRQNLGVDLKITIEENKGK